MNREAYRLANEIGAGLGADRDCLIDNLEDMDMKKYQTAVLDEIRKEKRRKGGKEGERKGEGEEMMERVRPTR